MNDEGSRPGSNFKGRAQESGGPRGVRGLKGLMRKAVIGDAVLVVVSSFSLAHKTVTCNLAPEMPSTLLIA